MCHSPVAPKTAAFNHASQLAGWLLPAHATATSGRAAAAAATGAAASRTASPHDLSLPLLLPNSQPPTLPACGWPRRPSQFAVLAAGSNAGGAQSLALKRARSWLLPTRGSDASAWQHCTEACHVRLGFGW